MSDILPQTTPVTDVSPTHGYSPDAALERLRQFNGWFRHGSDQRDKRVNDLPGVNVIGYLRDESGWGAAGRGYVRALQILEIPMTLGDFSAFSSNRAQDFTLDTFDSVYPYDLNIVCVDAGQHFAVMSHLGADFFTDRYTIGAWAWELPQFPEQWFDRFAYYDEIWVGTSFIANALAPISPIPVVRIPPVLAGHMNGNRERGRRRIGASGDEFVFLFIFDVHSHMERKNPRAIIEAFKMAFRSHENARLVIKSVNADADPIGFGALRADAIGGNITLVDGYWPKEDIADLMAGCDCYVSLHRAEGTGLTISDAMSMGKPVIATGWSGNMDFMTVANSFPVRYTLGAIERTVGPYRAGNLWSSPSTSHAAELMQTVYRERDMASAIGRAAQQSLEAEFSERAIARLVSNRLRIIAERNRYEVFRQEMRAFFDGYQQLIWGIRETVRVILPEDASVLVVSKGDDALVNLGNVRASHFPQTADGTYAGHHPHDGDAAVAQIEELREQGAQFLLLPGTAYWWLDHYSELARYLASDCDSLWRDERCAIYQLK